MNDELEIIKMKKNSFEVWVTMFLMRGLDKIKYGELINDLYIQYTIKNDTYPKTLQEGVDIRNKVKFEL